MKTFVVSAVVAWAIAAVSFLSWRNARYEREAFATARAAVHHVVSAPIPSPRYAFLRHRTADGRPLLGANPDDKIVADAATEAERDGAFTRFLADGRVLDARPGAVALVAPTEKPASYPWLLASAALLAGLLAARFARRPEGAVLLAIAAHGPVAIGAIVLVAAAAHLTDRRGWTARAARAAHESRVAYAYLAPAAVGMGVLVLAPFVAGCVLGFYDHARGGWQYVGLRNFTQILGGGGRPLVDPLNFWFTLGVTLLWTACNVALHVTIGVTLALALREKWVKARGLFRVLLILPWAIPNYITAMIWHGMFLRQFGAVNALLAAAHVPPVAWYSRFATSFTADVVTNTWLGFPFMMVVALGALESIPRDLYEAAAVDGATAWQRFRAITLPNLRPALMPAVVLGSIWTFNQFNVIYLVSGGKPAGSTDILVTQAYRWAFERGQRYGMAAAYATIIFLILVLWTTIANRLSRRAAATA
jgi:arabinogalactan oligomer/maltooligosaccharide transport system permease protein